VRRASTSGLQLARPIISWNPHLEISLAGVPPFLFVFLAQPQLQRDSGDRKLAVDSRLLYRQARPKTLDCAQHYRPTALAAARTLVFSVPDRLQVML
jgi:hypothetical protein